MKVIEWDMSFTLSLSNLLLATGVFCFGLVSFSASLFLSLFLLGRVVPSVYTHCTVKWVWASPQRGTHTHSGYPVLGKLCFCCVVFLAWLSWDKNQVIFPKITGDITFHNVVLVEGAILIATKLMHSLLITPSLHLFWH